MSTDDTPEKRYAAILNNMPFPDDDLDDIYQAHTFGVDPAVRQLADGIFPLIKNLNNRLQQLEDQLARKKKQ